MSLDVPYPGPDRNIGPLALGLNWTEAALAIIVVSLRFYAQSRIVGHIHFDDWLMLFALVCYQPPMTCPQEYQNLIQSGRCSN